VQLAESLFNECNTGVSSLVLGVVRDGHITNSCTSHTGLRTRDHIYDPPFPSIDLFHSYFLFKINATKGG